jgi:hypothetical protein
MLSSSRSVAFSAFVSGSLRGLLLRPGRSGARAVLVCSFGCLRRAGRFAARWARRLGRSVVVRRVAGLFEVSVPVALASCRWPRCVGFRLSWSGGLRGFVAALGAGGLVRGV